jgi:hypothetical protein
MSNIHDLKVADITNLILINNYSLPINDDEKYKLASELMEDKNTNYKGASSNIIKWMLARNALLREVKIPDNINNLSQHELNVLAKNLGMKGNNIDNIKDIVRYMDNSKSLFEQVFNKYTELYKPLLSNSQFDSIISALKHNPEIRKEIIANSEEILSFNGYVNGSYDDDFNQKFNKFLNELILLEEYEIIKKIANLYNPLYKRIFNVFFQNNMLDKYFEFIYNDNPVNLKSAIFYTLSEIQEKNRHRNILGNIDINWNGIDMDRYHLLSEVLQFAVDNEKLDIIRYLKDEVNLKSFYIAPPKTLGLEKIKHIRELISAGNKLLSKK